MQGHPLITLGRSPSGNVWLSNGPAEIAPLATLPAKDLPYEVMPSEEAVGRAMLDENEDCQLQRRSDRGSAGRRAWGTGVAQASHLASIKPGSGATYNDVAGLIPISQSILEHPIRKFKAGGTAVTEVDEAECRAAKHILTLGPAAILGARRVVQSIVDADTAPAKRESYRRLLTTEIADDAETRERQFDDNPGLWLRVHPNVRSLILADVLEN